MKNYLLIFALFCLLSPVMADDEVYLDLNTADAHQYKTFAPDFHNEKTEKPDDFDMDMVIHPFQYIKEELLDRHPQKDIADKKVLKTYSTKITKND